METKRDLNFGLRRLALEHGVPLRKLAEKLDISYAECLNWWSEPGLKLPLSKIRNLAWAIGASDDDLVNGHISQSTVDTGVLDYPDKINPKYLNNPFSYTMSSRHIIEYMHLRYGAFVTKGILFKLGVHPDYFRSIQNRISILFFEDLLKEFLALGNSPEDVQKLSRVIYLTTEEDPDGGRLFRQCHQYKDAFHVIWESTAFFDENFVYNFEINPDKIRIITKPTERLVDSTKNPHYGSQELYQYRSQLFGNMVTLCGLPQLNMKTVKCLSQGDNCSIYEADYNDSYFLSSCS